MEIGTILGASVTRVHVDRLKRYQNSQLDALQHVHPPSELPDAEAQADASGDAEEGDEEEYEVEKVVARRRAPGKHGAVQYKVRWKGWSKEYDSWLQGAELEGCKRLVEEDKRESIY